MFWHEQLALQSVTDRRSTCNDTSGLYCCMSISVADVALQVLDWQQRYWTAIFIIIFVKLQT